MTSSSIAALVQEELDRFIYIRPEGTLGHPASEADVAAEVELLWSCLVEPESRPVIIRDTFEQLKASRPTVESAWIVARAPDGAIVLFHPVEGNFGLAYEDADGSVETIGVRGDLVGTFMAR